MSLALSPLWTDVAEELFKVTKISPNCHLIFKNDTGILILQDQVYLDDKQHIYTWTILKFSFPSVDRAASQGHQDRIGTAVAARWFSNILPSGPLLWPLTSEKRISKWIGKCPIYPLNLYVTSFSQLYTFVSGPVRKLNIRAFPHL